jgi:large subunit ribosomal protein L31
MKSGIHPEYVESTVHCACGNTFTTRSTKANMRVDICSKCHPFFTGDQRLVDTGGQVERFMRRAGKGRGGVVREEATADSAS